MEQNEWKSSSSESGNRFNEKRKHTKGNLEWHI